jgi:hypothetical protein
VPSCEDHFIFNGALGMTRAEVEARPGGDFDVLLETAFALSALRRPRGLGRLKGVSELARLMRDQRVRVSFVPASVQDALLGAAATR